MIITTLGPIPYSSDKAVPWNDGAEVYYHGIKQDSWIDEDKTADITNIDGSSKVTRTGRISSPNISPPTTTTTPVRITVDKPSTDARGKEKMSEPARMEAPAKDIITEEPSTQEMEEILKIIRKIDYKIVEQLGKTPSEISMLSLLICSNVHTQALINFLKNVHVPQETTADLFENCVTSLTIDNGLGFSDIDLTPSGRNHNKALHVSIECKGTTISHVSWILGPL